MPVLTDGTNRTTRAALQLGPHAIPAGTMVWVPFGATFASARAWERADEYLPARPPRRGCRWLTLPPPALCTNERRPAPAGCAQERWDDADAEYEQPPPGRPPAACADGDSSQPARARRFFPFSLGRRDCVGQSLARMNYLATVATLLSEFRFRLADEARAAPAAPPRLPARPRPDRAPRRRWAAWRACASAPRPAFSRCSPPTACSCTARRADAPAGRLAGRRSPGKKGVVC